MNEHLPYEEQLNKQWENLPLPAVDAAWADMKRRLEEDDDDKGIVWWRRGCLLWGLLLLALLGTGWWLFRPEKWFDSKKRGTVTTTAKKDNSRENINNDSSTTKKLRKDNIVISHPDSIRVINKDTISSNRVIEKSGTKKIVPQKEIIAEKTETLKRKNSGTKKKQGKIAVGDKKIPVKEKMDEPVVIKDPVVPDSSQGKPSVKDPEIVKNEPVVKKEEEKTIITDTAKQKPVLPLQADNKKEKKDSTEKNPVFFSAGLGLHQLIPIAGQKFTPYNSLGRKGSLADYIPSIYLRMEKKDKWFLQAAFRYGAPQYTKEFTYRQLSVPDSGANPVYSTVYSSSLKKTFYHQLPLAFNYFIRPGWSAGAGIQWNRFSSAVSEKQVSRKNNFTQQDSVVSKIITKEDTSSVFRKSYFQAILESQFRWKRFSFGARYSFGLQPYIEFTLPGGARQQEKNSSFQLFIQYELWKSKK